MVEPRIPTSILEDFNTVFHRSMDRRGSSPLDDCRESSAAFREFFFCRVADIWSDLHPLAPSFTWESPDHATASRIDLIGCPAVWPTFLSFCDIVSCIFSDHAAVHLSNAPPVPIPQGPGRWKCNVSVLKDLELRSEIEYSWFYWRNTQPFFPTVGKWWDKGKKVTKSLISHYCSAKVSKKSPGARSPATPSQPLEGKTWSWTQHEKRHLRWLNVSIKLT